MNTVRLYFSILLAFVFLFAATGCVEEKPFPIQSSLSTNTASCVGCHTNYDLLRQIAAPDTAAAGGGCGGDAPHIEVYDRVHLGGDGFIAFQNTTHGKMNCTDCHGGVDNTSNKAAAHGGSFVRHPSSHADVICAPCHSGITNHFANSIHAQGWGQKSMVTLRAGVSSFDALPQSVKDGYEVNCAKCHGGCGDCHVNRPKAGGGGLYRGHQFLRTPDMRDQCVACHVSRGGHAYFGVASGTVPDVHLTRLGNGHCINCHSRSELHGNGIVYDQRYKMPEMPNCYDCHKSIATKNAYHAAHYTTFSCNVCHSQDYNNCGSCHIGGDGARIPSHQKFKIGFNPIPETRSFKYALLRQSLTAPDSWKNYGISSLANFDARPTYKYTTPHNLIRWTTRTQVPVGKACYDNCHIINENGTYRNKSLYLFNSDLQSWEVNADAGIVVDGKLPQSWNVQ